MHFFPLGNPSRKPSESKYDGKHVLWDADRTVDDAAVEIDVGIELAFDEVVVFQRYAFHVSQGSGLAGPGAVHSPLSMSKASDWPATSRAGEGDVAVPIPHHDDVDAAGGGVDEPCRPMLWNG